MKTEKSFLIKKRVSSVMLLLKNHRMLDEYMEKTVHNCFLSVLKKGKLDGLQGYVYFDVFLIPVDVNTKQDGVGFAYATFILNKKGELLVIEHISYGKDKDSSCV